jgi:predicted dehydrogenase
VESEREHTDARQRYRTRAYRIEATPSESSAENFLRCIRTQEKPVLDGELSYRAQVAVSLGAMAFRCNRVTFFDPVQERVMDT